ncbi:MAG: hypothetical protein CMN76_15320 [Spirochaetaceae bacterium]|nr:hypothetical protein [Spirochaetaceae bacterium]|tara:strand:+ start:133616 stop:134059 length:444 start_codon:yes stop_codon:yes gene_type:complete
METGFIVYFNQPSRLQTEVKWGAGPGPWLELAVLVALKRLAPVSALLDNISNGVESVSQVTRIVRLFARFRDLRPEKTVSTRPHRIRYLRFSVSCCGPGTLRQKSTLRAEGKKTRRELSEFATLKARFVEMPPGILLSLSAERNLNH